jgi:hypothetical protein
MGQQTLQSFHPAPSANLCCLSDMRLESCYLNFNIAPSCTEPHVAEVRGRTSVLHRRLRSGVDCRHLLSLVKRLIKFSRHL